MRIELPAVVDVRRQRLARRLEQLGIRADRLLVPAAVADPDRQRRSPVAVARQRPVDQVLEPVAEAALADVGRMPVDAAVVLDQPLLPQRGADEPAVGGVEQERLVAAPAEGVAVAVALVMEQAPGALELGGDRLVGVLEPEAGPGVETGAGADHAGGIDRLELRQSEGLSGPVVVLAEERRGVDDPGAVGGGDVVAGDHQPAERVGRDVVAGVGVARARRHPQRPVVAQAEERLSREARHGLARAQIDLRRLAVGAAREERHRLLEAFGEDQEVGRAPDGAPADR